MASITARGLIVMLVMLWFPMLQADESPLGGQAASQGESAVVPDTAASPVEPRAAKGKGFSVFLIVLAVSLLFVLGSAMALSGMGGKRPPPRQGKGDRDAGD